MTRRRKNLLTRWLAALALGCVLPSAEARIKHVIHISVDGLRGDMLRDLVAQSPFIYRTFVRIQIEGAVTYNARCDAEYSITNPNHVSMVTGLPVEAPASAPAWQQHGYLPNYELPNDTLHHNGLPAGYKNSVFDRVHDRGLKTMALVSKEKLALFDRSYNQVNGAPDTDGEDNGPDKIDIAFTYENDSSVLVAALTARMDAGFPAYTFLHICDPDYAGHGYGWGSLNYNLAVKHADTLIGLILSGLDLRPELKAATAVIISADHGGGVPSYTHVDHTQRENYTIPLLLWGAGIPARRDAYSLFANRFNPGEGRPPNDSATPPLRNGDTGNIAMALLGLPPITNSYFRPEWQPGLSVAKDGLGYVTLQWPGYLTGYTLESSDSLVGEPWSPVSEAGRVYEGHEWRFRVMGAPPMRYYRLRAPQ